MHFLREPHDGVITFAEPGARPAWFWPDVSAIAMIALAALAAIAVVWFLLKRSDRWTGTYLAPAALMIGALAPWPHLYYDVLRLTTLGCLGYELFTLQPWRWTRRQVILLTILLIYNPMIPLHLPRTVWVAINVISAGVLLVEMLRITRPLSAREVDEAVSPLLRQPDRRQ